MRRWQSRDAKVDTCSSDRYAGPSSLRAQAVGDVHLRHDLDARHQGNANGLRENHDLLEHPIDPIPNGDSALARFEMDIARTGGDSFGDDVVDQLDHWPLDLFLVQLGLGVVGLFDDVAHW